MRDRSFRLLLGPLGLNGLYSFASDFQCCCLTDKGSPSVMQHILSVESLSLLLHSYLTYLSVDREDSLTSYRNVMRTEQPTKFCTTSVTEDEVACVKLV